MSSTACVDCADLRPLRRFHGYIAGRSERHAIIFGGTLIAVLAASLLLAGHSSIVAAIAVVLWGAASGWTSGRRPSPRRLKGTTIAASAT